MLYLINYRLYNVISSKDEDARNVYGVIVYTIGYVVDVDDVDDVVDQEVDEVDDDAIVNVVFPAFL